RGGGAQLFVFGRIQQVGVGGREPVGGGKGHARGLILQFPGRGGQLQGQPGIRGGGQRLPQGAEQLAAVGEQGTQQRPVVFGHHRGGVAGGLCQHPLHPVQARGQFRGGHVPSVPRRPAG